jgi:23S rRNA (adenine2503-C2)-methyltransferase
MPIGKKYPLSAVLKAVDDYIKKTNRQVMFEYVLINGVNDSDECAEELARLAKKPLYYVNLILYNATGIYKASTTERVEKFKEILKNNKIVFSQRYRFGDDIQAACGQFATNK